MFLFHQNNSNQLLVTNKTEGASCTSLYTGNQLSWAAFLESLVNGLSALDRQEQYNLLIYLPV